MSILYIDKPKGMTSFDICFRLRKVLGTKKIGHTGTLDPNATGLMIVLSEKDTKANQFLVSDYKEYIGECLIGIKTDTLDIDGNILEEKTEIMPDRSEIITVLNSFIGDSMQLPPMTSAIKVDGKKLYEYQREGKSVELKPRPITVFEIELLDLCDKTFTFRCRVSSGTYIRVLLQDILAKLNIIGTLKELRRTSINEISVTEADKLEDVLKGNYRIHDLHELLTKRYPEIEVENTFDFVNGKRVKLNCDYDEVLISHSGKCIAIYKKEKNYYVSKRGLF